MLRGSPAVRQDRSAAQQPDGGEARQSSGGEVHELPEASGELVQSQWRSHSLPLGSADPDESAAIPYKFTVHHYFLC